MYDPKKDKPEFSDGYGPESGKEMQLPPMSMYDLVTEVLSPEELYQVFNTGDRRKLKRVEDVERALIFINESLNSDRFNYPKSDEWNIQELLMKGYLLERVRFRILREEWEPVFNPFPNDPLNHYDPDITVQERKGGGYRMYFKVRNHPELPPLSTQHITSPSNINDHYSVKEMRGKEKFSSEYLTDALDAYHTHLEQSDEYPEEYVNEVGNKLGKVLIEFRRLTDDEEQIERIDEVIEE